MPDKKKGLFKEFREFLDQGNVMGMAVGIIIGGAFTALVTALITDVINPIITMATGGTGSASGLAIAIPGSDQVIDFGAFISAIINFVLIAFVVFMLVRSYNKAKATAEKVMRGRGDGSDDVPVARTCPYCGEEIADDAVRCPHCTSILPNASAADVSAMDGTR